MKSRLLWSKLLFSREMIKPIIWEVSNLFMGKWGNTASSHTDSQHMGSRWDIHSNSLMANLLLMVSNLRRAHMANHLLRVHMASNLLRVHMASNLLLVHMVNNQLTVNMGNHKSKSKSSECGQPFDN